MLLILTKLDHLACPHTADPRGPPERNTSVFPGDILQKQIAVLWHVLLKPGPTVDLLVSRRNHEEAESETHK